MKKAKGIIGGVCRGAGTLLGAGKGVTGHVGPDLYPLEDSAQCLNGHRFWAVEGRIVMSER